VENFYASFGNMTSNRLTLATLPIRRKLSKILSVTSGKFFFFYLFVGKFLRKKYNSVSENSSTSLPETSERRSQ